MPTKRPTEVSYTPHFENAAKRLQKKYRHIDADLRVLVEKLEQGETPGDQIQKVGYTVFKVRLKNSDAAKGKSGGYRVIYYLKTATHTVLLTIYTKSDYPDIAIHLIRGIIEDYES